MMAAKHGFALFALLLVILSLATFRPSPSTLPPTLTKPREPSRTAAPPTVEHGESQVSPATVSSPASSSVSTPATVPAAPDASPLARDQRSVTLYSKYPEIRLPSFAIVGNQKCGSTTLSDWLMRHPKVIRGTKEFFYFDRQRDTELEYVRKFPNCTKVDCQDKITLDASITYAFHPHSGERLREVLPDIKLMFMTRNPVDRAHSKYRMNIRLQKEVHWSEFTYAVKRDVPMVKEFLREYESQRLSPEETVWEYQERLHGKNRLDHRWGSKAYLTGSLYALLIPQFTKLWPRDRILVISSLSLDTKPKETLDEVLAFMGLESMEIPMDKKNQFPPGDEMDPETRKILEDFFRPYNHLFRQQMGIDIDLETPN